MILRRTLGLAVLAACCLASVPALAGGDPIYFGGWGGFSLGGRYLPVGDLNDYLDGAGVDEVSPLCLTLGGQAHGLLFDRLVLGVRGSYAGRAVESGDAGDLDPAFDKLEVTLTDVTGEFNVGYAVLNGATGVAYPYLGLGGVNTSMKLTGDVWALGIGPRPTAEGQIAVGNSPPEIRDSATLDRGAIYATAGFTYMWPVRFAQSQFGAFGMFAPAVTAGATVELVHTGWLDGGDTVRGGPDFPFHTAFIQLELNFGGGTIWRTPAQ